MATSDWKDQAVQFWLCALFTGETYPALSPMTQGLHNSATLALPSRAPDLLAAAFTMGLTVGVVYPRQPRPGITFLAEAILS